jgi:copper chaperone
METLKLKSNIKCAACVEKVTAPLNETVGANNWEVDLTNPQRVLTVKGDGITPKQINEALQKVGYSAETIR